MSFMFNPHPYDDPRPVNRPALSARAVDSIIAGDHDIARFLARTIEEKLDAIDRSYLVVCIDGYATAEWGVLIRLLSQQLTLRNMLVDAIDVANTYRSSEKLDEMLAENLPEDLEKDPVLLFGKLFTGDYESLFDPAAFKQLGKSLGDKDTSDPDRRSVKIVHGAGACFGILADLADLALYLDVTPKEAVLRVKAGRYVNLGDRVARPFKAMMRRCYYYDFELASHHRAHLLRSGRIDFYVTHDILKESRMIDREALDEICTALVTYPFRCKPVYLEGIWGGHFVTKHRSLPAQMKNCAWVFDLIPLEVSLLIEVGANLIEMPYFTFVCKEGVALMGQECVEAFGGYFPIRFNYDDSYHSSGNMSIQLHPTKAYAREHFGELGAQNESYYLVATGHDAKTYMGLQDDIDPQDFIDAVKESERTRSPVDYERYVGHVESRPGTQVLVPAGTIHSSGRNQVVLEIGSLTVGSYTFKMYDYLRNDLDGNPRPIHSYHGERELNRDRTTSWAKENLVQEPILIHSGDDWTEFCVGDHDLLYFSLYRYEFLKKVEGETNGVFHVLALVDGERVVVRSKKHPERRYEMRFLDIVVVPANLGAYVIENLGEDPVCVHKTHLKNDFRNFI